MGRGKGGSYQIHLNQVLIAIVSLLDLIILLPQPPE